MITAGALWVSTDYQFSPYDHNTYDIYVYYMNSDGIVVAFFNGGVNSDSCGISINHIHQKIIYHYMQNLPYTPTKKIKISVTIQKNPI